MAARPRSVPPSISSHLRRNTPAGDHSRGSREKLVFRVEAAPSPEDATRLRPGLPLDVTVAGQ